MTAPAGRLGHPPGAAAAGPSPAAPGGRIATVPRPACPVCGGSGDHRHRALEDRLFGAPGRWDLRRCRSPHCGTLWLDPAPRPEALGLAYARYYTHRGGPTAEAAPRQPGRARFASASLALRHGYGTAPRRPAAWLLRALLTLWPAERDAHDGAVRLLPALPGGRLLDVGCGSGAWLLGMRARGWSVAGVEPDRQAADVARSLGLAVHHGTLETAAHDAGSFDAVTLNHVIEHVPDPAATLRECARLLRPGGRLVLFTPNAGSLGHRLFGADWRGLEPPRHLQVLTLPATARLLAAAGFVDVKVRPWQAPSVIEESLLLRRPGLRRGRWGAAGLAALCCAGVRLALPLQPAWGDCVAATATARGGDGDAA